MAGPLTNVTLKSIVLMYLLSLGPSSNPGHSLEASGPLSLWDWVCGHLLSPCCTGPPLPAPTPVRWPAHLTCFPSPPHHLVHTTPTWGTVCLLLSVCLPRKQLLHWQKSWGMQRALCCAGSQERVRGPRHKGKIVECQCQVGRRDLSGLYPTVFSFLSGLLIYCVVRAGLFLVLPGRLGV